MSDRHTDGVRVIAIVALAICLAVVVIAAGVFIMAASREAKEFLGFTTTSFLIASFIGALAWGSAKAMRT